MESKSCPPCTMITVYFLFSVAKRHRLKIIQSPPSPPRQRRSESKIVFLDPIEEDFPVFEENFQEIPDQELERRGFPVPTENPGYRITEPSVNRFEVDSPFIHFTSRELRVDQK